jgi:hypothetical protein
VLTANFCEESLNIIIFKRKFTAEHDIKNNTGTPDIDLRPCIQTTSNNLGSGIIGAATACLEKIPVLDFIGEAKIGDFNIEIIIKKHILRFKIAMDDLEAMRVLDARNQLLEEATGLMFGHTTICDDEVEKLAACKFKDNDDIGRC